MKKAGRENLTNELIGNMFINHTLRCQRLYAIEERHGRPAGGPGKGKKEGEWTKQNILVDFTACSPATGKDYYLNQIPIINIKEFFYFDPYPLPCVCLSFSKRTMNEETILEGRVEESFEKDELLLQPFQEDMNTRTIVLILPSLRFFLFDELVDNSTLLINNSILRSYKWDG
jgi:hypothetical protein